MQNSHANGARQRSRFRSRGFNRYNRGSRPQIKSKEVPISRFINSAVELQTEQPYSPRHQFNDFDLNIKTKNTLEYLGFKSPSPIQDQCIKPALDGRDVIGLANTGTGKTAAFLLPTIEKILHDKTLVSALILAPTRELAGQIDSEFRRFSAGQKLYSTLIVGGESINRQINQVKRGPHIIIGTPGRVKDLIDRHVIRLGNISTFILDEADRMCDMGFARDIRYIANFLPAERQTLCFSATMTSDVEFIVKEFMRDPLSISVVKKQTNDHIEQDVIYASDKMQKVEILTELLGKDDFEKVIIFGETKYGVQRLSDRLAKDGHLSVAIHGNKSQSQRQRALDDFKVGKVNILVATDVAARGLDIPNVSHVINFDTPKAYEDYIHRIGRTGRAGKTGVALTFVEKRV
jgi:ATP-dependent RNA helicase RhlE